MRYLWLLIIFIVIIIIICVVVFSTNSDDDENGKSKCSNKSVEQIIAPKQTISEKSSVTVEITDTGDKVVCSENKHKHKDGFELEFRMCGKKSYNGIYIVRNLKSPYKHKDKHPSADNQHWKGDVSVVSHKEYPVLKGYLDYDLNNNYYLMKIVDEKNKVVTFNQWSRCTTIRILFHRRSSPMDNGPYRSHSSRRSSLSSNDHSDYEDEQSDFSYDYSDSDLVDPYEQAEHCGNRSDWSFYSTPSECKGRKHSDSSS